MATTEEPNENDKPTSTINNFIYLILAAGNTISSLL